MLVNFSNHAVEYWDESQYSAATTAFGEVVDLQFPAVNPAATTAQVSELAADYAQRIADAIASNHRVGEADAVLVAGEQSLLFAIVSLLQRKGITCLAACSERISKLNADGSKTVGFNFVQFREFPK